MKTMKLATMLFLALGVVLTSCEKGEEGDIGPTGPQGEQGIPGEQGSAGEAGSQGEPGQDGANGQNGMDGQNGVNGQDGQDGADGRDGVNGNANVISRTIDISDWNDPTGPAIYNASVPELTSQVIQDDAILFYLKSNWNGEINVVPGDFIVRGFSGRMEVKLVPGTCRLTSLKTTTTPDSETSGAYVPILTNELDYIRVVIIKSTSSSKGNSSKQRTLEELKAAGVDINDYQQVADYLGLED